MPARIHNTLILYIPAEQIAPEEYGTQLADSAATPKWASPAAPDGILPIDNTTVQDAITGRRCLRREPLSNFFLVLLTLFSHKFQCRHRFYSLISSPVRLTRPGPHAAPRYFDPARFPTFLGQGMSMTWWYKHCDPAGRPSCALFLWVKVDAGVRSDSRCWSFRMESDGLYWNNPRAAAVYDRRTDFVREEYRVHHGTWRHLALVLDEIDDHLYYYQDGQLALRAPWGSSVSQADCRERPGLDLCDRPGDVVALGHRFPGYAFGDEAEVHDLRMYVGEPLPAAGILALAQAPTPELGSNATCVPEALLLDTWESDAAGRTCAWYASQRGASPQVCSEPFAVRNCPVACRARRACLSNSTDPDVFWTWKSIQRIEAKAANGTICLSDSILPQRIFDECRSWRAANLNLSAADWLGGAEWLQSLLDFDGSRLDVTSCEALEAAVDPNCSFSSAAVRNFTQASIGNGGDYTVAFWVKPIGESAAGGPRTFVPQAHFMASLVPPRHNLGVGMYRANDNPSFRINSACAAGPDIVYENSEFEFKGADIQGWTMLAFARTNSTPEQNAAHVNLIHNIEPSGFKQCFFNPATLFEAIEFNSPMLVSPIMMIPQAVSLARVQRIFYQYLDGLSIRDGPRPSGLSDQRVPLQKNDYPFRFAMIAPPILLQNRVNLSDTCPVSFSNTWLGIQREKVDNLTCAPPYQCSDDVLEHPSMTMACRGAPIYEDPMYRSEAIHVGKSRFFVELLYSIADNDFLYRNGELRSRRSLFNAQTASLTLYFFFYTPEIGVATVLTVSSDFSASTPASVKVDVSHINILEGPALYCFLAVQGCLFLVACSIFMSAWSGLLGAKQGTRLLTAWKLNGSKKAHGLQHVIDLLNVTLISGYLAAESYLKCNSSADIERIAGNISLIPWESTSVSLTAKER